MKILVSCVESHRQLCVNKILRVHRVKCFPLYTNTYIGVKGLPSGSLYSKTPCELVGSVGLFCFCVLPRKGKLTSTVL